MLFEVDPTGPLTLAVPGVQVLGVATAATVFPAMRAIRVDPAGRVIRLDSGLSDVIGPVGPRRAGGSAPRIPM